MDMINFSPHDDALNSVVEVLRDSLVPDTEIQRKVQDKIITMQKHPDFASYLMYILRNEAYEEHVRSLSALILKNNLLVTFNTLSQDVLNVIRRECMNLITDSSKDVRSSVTTLIGTLLWLDLSSWPDLVPHLCALIDSNDGQVSDSALMALFKVCEEFLTKNDGNNEIINVVLSKVIILTTNERYNVRQNAIKLINQAMVFMKLPDSNLYMNNLFMIIKDDDPEIQKLVCQGFRLFIENHEDCIMPHIHSVIEYMMYKTKSDDKDVALQACEFWLDLTKLPNCRDIISLWLERLLPILLENMKYSDYELCAIRDIIGDDDDVDDKAEDICPFGMRSDDNFEGINTDQNDGYVGWTLRKCSAASLDALSVQCGNQILPYFLPLMNEALSSEDELIKETGILALGAIAEGCIGGLRLYLPELLPYLLQCMECKNSLIRVITCWTISRFTTWVMEPHTTNSFFTPVMTGLLTHFLDRNKRVQRAALSAFCIFQEEALHKLTPYIEFILQAFAHCFKRLKFRSYLLLYDAIGVLAQSVGNALNNPQYIEFLMPALMIQFNANDNYYDEHFMALVECLSNVVVALEVGFLPYTEVIYNRCLTIINETVNAIQCFGENPDEFDNPDRDAMSVAHDMLLGMATGLKTYFVKFVTNSNLVQNLYYTIQDETIYVRQPALALYGELIKLCFPHISQTVHSYIPFIIENIDKRYDVACNNATWVIGKLCLAMGDKMEPYAAKITLKFLDIIPNMDGTKTMCQTVAISFCTLGLVCPDHVSPHLASLIRPCCQAMRNVGDCDEKDVGFRGLCTLIQCNPTAAMNDFGYFCDAIASWNDGIRPDLKDTIKNILLCFQAQLGPDRWAQFNEQFPSMLKMRLDRLYGM